MPKDEQWEQGKAFRRRGPEAGGRQVVWKDGGLRSVYANAAHVTGSREEILLRFGTSGPGDPSTGEKEVQWTDAVALGPVVAKRLALLMDRVMVQHEERFGRLDPDSSVADPSPAPVQFSPEVLRSHSRAGRLIALVEALGVQPLFERSFKLSEAAVNANRFLLGLPKREIEPEAGDKLQNLCRHLDSPEPYLSAIVKDLPDSDFVHFGFEASGGRYLYKAYLEFSTRLERMAEADPEALRAVMKGPDPFLLFLGFKWNPEDARDRAFTKYRWYPGISFGGMLSRAREILEGEESNMVYKILTCLLERVSNRVRHDQVNFFDVLEDESGRRSFDVNVYDAKLRIEDIQGLFPVVCREFALSEETLLPLLDRIRHEILGHLSGGVDRCGKEFLSFYHGGGRLQKQEPWAEGFSPGRA